MAFFMVGFVFWQLLTLFSLIKGDINLINVKYQIQNIKFVNQKAI